MVLYANLYGPTDFEYPGGSFVRRVPITVRQRDTQELAMIYTSRDKIAQAANPVFTDAVGNFSFWADPGEYELEAPGGVELLVIIPKHPYEPDSGENAALLGYTHTQSVASAQWIINHNLGRPLAAIEVEETTGDRLVLFGISRNDEAFTILRFDAPTAGTAHGI